MSLQNTFLLQNDVQSLCNSLPTLNIVITQSCQRKLSWDAQESAFYEPEDWRWHTTLSISVLTPWLGKSWASYGPEIELWWQAGGPSLDQTRIRAWDFWESFYDFLIVIKSSNDNHCVSITTRLGWSKNLSLSKENQRLICSVCFVARIANEKVSSNSTCRKKCYISP